MWRFALFIFTVAPQLAFAGSDLMVFPNRLVFDKNTRSAQIDLTNTGSEITTYRITLANKRMTEAGGFTTITSPASGELFADKLIQYSPRQVELAPGAGQTIRIIVRKPAELAPGEYRSHLIFSRVPDARSTSIEKNDEDQGGEIGIQLIPLFGISIPIFIEHGDTTSTSLLTDLKFIKSNLNEPPILELRINRKGNRSVYGDLSVTFIPKKGSEESLAYIKGVAVYSPNASRLVKIALRSKSNESIEHGRINVEFSSNQKERKKLIFSENSLELP